MLWKNATIPSGVSACPNRLTRDETHGKAVDANHSAYLTVDEAIYALQLLDVCACAQWLRLACAEFH